MTIDKRKKVQRFKNLYGLNDVYVHKNGRDNYSVGINGTNHHEGNLPAHKAELIVSLLIFAKS